MYIQLMRSFYGKSAETRKYLQKRKRKRKQFKNRLDSYDYSQYEFERHKLEVPVDKFSDDELDDEEDYNYYTDSDEEEDDAEDDQAE